ncbi:T9SS type A sorting domain-containing protein [Prevotella brevis]|uniref:T9SS type A sorting domain-containing protein n=1 Tax=Xylanibacter brevis TaxID=83231 RepID=A0ABS9CF21_9BACT|nr:T9SS type A sorting domain-containing protein [Xylanibacter brevis]MCF2563596.1 T9SS type A sorting domain-containing protein [Xylanibacter brevis]
MPYIRNPYGIEMQQVHEYEYTYYVTGGSEIDLPLPFENYTTESNKDMEPKGYIRWYDYNTDMANPRLSVYNTTNLKEVNDNNDKARGLFAWKNKTNSEPSGPSRNKVGVKYKAPTDADDATWKGEDVACDVSKYTDFAPMVSGKDQYFNHEPTLQIRYIFHIRPAKAMAENIIKTTATDLRTADSDLTIEDNRRIVFGAKDANARMSVRVNYKPSNYFFYPLKPQDGKQRHLLSSDEAHSIKQADYDKSTLYNANGFVWYAYDETKTKYTVLVSRGTVQLHDFTSMNVLMNNGNGWKNLDGTPTTKPNIKFGSIVYLVAYAYYYETNNADNSIKAPIASFEILYQNTYPKTMQQLKDDGDNERTLAYFESHYKQATKPISFDDDNDQLTVVAPTKENNMAHYASRWDRRAYSFVYPELRDYACPNGKALIHGEYGLFKSANLAGISDNSVTSTTGKKLYQWWNSAVLHDRTHAITNGKQYGYFLYVDASDESRQIASIDFKADLCSGARLIFSAAVTDFTGPNAPVRPQVLFKIYGIIKDENDKVTHQRLLTSFTSGDFASNTKGGRQLGTWFQVYSRIVMRKNMGVENYSDFRIVLDNMCASTYGADYAIDDIRLYIQHAKVDVLQNQPACPDAKSGSIANHEITLKITSHYENVQAITGVGKESKLFYRISDMDGKPFAGIDYNGDGTADEYGEVTIPANYDASSSAFEIDPEGHVILVIDNRHFDLPLGKKFYVSVAYPDADGNPDEWGKFTDECSSYSDAFSIVQQKVVISDANGSLVTTVRVSCDGNSTPDVDINAKLETADKVGGGSILLNNVKFDWFVGTPDGADNKFSSISGLQEALGKYRLKFPDATSLNAAFQTSNPADYALLEKYIAGVDGEGTLVLAVSNSLTGYKFKQVGTYKIAAVPIATSIKQGTVTYEICSDPMYFTIRIVEDGPKLILGFDKVAYPTDDRAVRIGLPQIREMLKKADNGMLILPVVELNNGKDENIEIKFLDDQKVFISDSNDPTFTSTKQIVGKLKEETLASGKKTLGLVFDDNVLDILHEGYWYELNFSYELHNSTTTAACPGDLFITLKVVPEYLTWFPSVANKLNANWNNDLNWKRSTAAELYDKKYEDYGEATYDNTANSSLTRQQAYTPMKFSKVVIPENKLVYPGLGNIVYRVSNDIATKLTNFKGEEATSGIEYDFVVTWNDNTADPDDHSTDGNGTFKCETFHGNLCDQIFFKAQAELLNQPYLIYNKAFVEKEVESNKWNLVSTPMKNIYAGDFFVPKTTGREESKTAFSAMNFDGTSDNRVAAPVYQRNWDSNETQIVDGVTNYKAHDYNGTNISIDTISDASMNVESLYWSHVYNKLDENYSEGKGFALKAGDQYKTLSAKWLFRLPKEDEEYKYFEPDGGYSDLNVSVPKHEKYMLNVPYSNEPGLLGEISQPLTSNTHSNNRYYIVGNPYTASLSMYQFLNGNPSFERKVWTLVDGVLKAHSVPEGTYNRSQDYIIEPMQGFFVKVKEGETVSQANFTLMMTTDRWISGGTAVQEPAAVYINVVNDDNLCSTAKVVVCNDADDEFVDDEDVELLNNSDIEDVPQVYTVAGNQAVALNKLSNINFLPLGIIAKVDGNVMSNGATVNVEISANRYVTDKLFVFDAKMGTFTPADAPISIMANEHGRYYITTSTYNLKQHNDEANIKCFSPNSGTITVSSPNIAIANVRIYNFEGLLVTSALGINQASWTKNIGCGLYIVKAETKDGQSKTFKLSVR